MGYNELNGITGGGGVEFPNFLGKADNYFKSPIKKEYKINYSQTTLCSHQVMP